MAAPSVPHGPLAYRRALRTFGPFAALLPPLLAALLAVVLLTVVPCEGRACVLPGGAGLVLGGFALPTAPLVGLPFRSGPALLALALVTSTALWLLLGAWAARRATRSPIADWRDWRREFRTMLLGVWAGLLGGLVLLAAVVLLLA
jgi:hypothetical protein